MSAKNYGKVGRRNASRQWRTRAIELIKADLTPETRATLETYSELGQLRFLNKFMPQYQQKAVRSLNAEMALQEE